MKLHRFNQHGLLRFNEFLDALADDPKLAVPTDLRTDPASVELVPPGIEVEDRQFTDRMDAGRYLYGLPNGNEADIGHTRIQIAGRFPDIHIRHFNAGVDPVRFCQGQGQPGNPGVYISQYRGSLRNGCFGIERTDLAPADRGDISYNNWYLRFVGF